MRKLLMFLFVGIFLFSLVSSEQTSLGTFKQNDCVDLIQTCADCTYVNFTRITYPNSSSASVNLAGTKSGSVFNAEFCNTTQLGDYIVYGIGDVSTTDTVFAYDFTITYNGNTKPDGFVVVIFTLTFIAIFFFGLLFFFQALEELTKFQMDLYDVTKLMGSYFAMWMFYLFATEYLGNSFIDEILELMIMVGGFTHVFLAIVGFLVSFIMTNLKFNKKSKVTY